jgi:hypothetical protein
VLEDEVKVVVETRSAVAAARSELGERGREEPSH